MKDLNTSLATQAGIAEKQLNANMQAPNQNDANAGLFDNLRQSLGERPRGWRAGASGLLSGMAHGARSQSIVDRKKDLDKMNKVMDYLSGINQQAIQRNQWYDKQNMAKEKYMPQLMAYADNASTMDAQSRMIMGQTILNGWNKDTGDQYKLLGIDGSDPMLLTVSDDSGQTKMMNIRDMFSNDKIINERMAAQLPHNVLKQQEDRHQQAFENKMKEREVKVLEQKYPEANGSIVKDPKERKALREQAQKLQPALEEYNAYLEAEKLLNDENSSPLYGSVTQTLGSLPFVGGVPSIVKSPEQAAFEVLQSNLTGHHFKKMGYRNETEYKKIKTINPNLSKEANLKIINDQKEALKKDVDKFNQINALLGDASLGQQIDNQQQASPQPNEVMHRVRAPNGAEKLIPESQLDLAIANGGEVIQ